MCLALHRAGCLGPVLRPINKDFLLKFKTVSPEYLSKESFAAPPI